MVFLIPQPQKTTPALTVRAVAYARAIAQTAPTVRPRVRLRSCRHGFCLAASFVTAAPVSRKPTSFSRTHYTSLRYIHCQPTRSFRLGHVLNARSELNGGVSHMTSNCIHFQRKVHSAPFRFIPSSFTQQACSPPAALVVLACAVVRAAGCHAFCAHTLLANARPAPFNKSPAHKQKITPALARSVSTHLPTHVPLPHS
jgi:hypothetical protein